MSIFWDITLMEAIFSPILSISIILTASFITIWGIKIWRSKAKREKSILLIYCNNYAPEFEQQLGSQPVRVFEKWFGNIFLNIYSEISKEYPHCKEIFCNYNHKEEKAVSPRVVFGTIIFDESFLSLLWACCYGVFTMSPRPDSHKKDFNTGLSVMKYGLSLLKDYTPWNKTEFPNPEYYSKNQHEQIGKANMCYVVALNFIFYHEFAHFVFEDEISTIENERRADLFAFQKLLNTIEDENDEATVYVGLVTALSVVILVSSTMKGIDHPDPDHRIIYLLEHLDLPDNHALWGQAGISFLIWKVIHGGEWKFPDKFENFKQFFNDTAKSIEEWKNK